VNTRKRDSLNTSELQLSRDALADKVIGVFVAAFRKLADHRNEIAALWDEFGKLQPGEMIKGCHTKTEFAEVHLGRNIRSVQYLLTGGNHNRRETVSPSSGKVIDITERRQFTSAVPVVKRGRQTGEAQKYKMVTGLSTITGICRGLAELNVEKAIAVCSDNEQKLWAKCPRELARKLRKFAVQVECAIDKAKAGKGQA
jgi:hypothetical protein